MDQRRLALLIGIDRNSVGLLLEGLERRGLVRRDLAQDRRARPLHLAQAGAQVAAGLAARGGASPVQKESFERIKMSENNEMERALERDAFRFGRILHG
jgi:DNA-binding MarR family transcriptional regulator